MSLLTWPGLLTVDRAGKEIVARFVSDMRVICTEPTAGGIREDVRACYDHQLCEAAGSEHEAIRQHHLDLLHSQRCERYGLDPQTTIALSTAANMRCAGFTSETFDDLSVAAVCTAGVEGNALRSGDPAVFHEVHGAIKLLDASPDVLPPAGTIISMVFINQELTPAALTRAVVTATEAKNAALTDLLVGSRYSQRLATGTGSDQILIACPRGHEHPLTEAGGHAKLGELIGRCVYAAVTEALDLQNTLTPSTRRALSSQLARFGVTKELILDAAGQCLEPAAAEFMASNFLSVDRDPFVVAAGGALAAIADQLASGMLPANAAAELAPAAGAMLAQAVSLGEGDLVAFQAELAGQDFQLTSLVPRAISLGFQQKWLRLAAALSDG